MTRHGVMIGFVLLAFVTGCAQIDYVRNASELVKAADWSQMETVEVSLAEYSFSPSSLYFVKGTPYKLTIKNDGSKKHYFTASTFFKSIATRKAQTDAAEIKAPYFHALEVFPDKSIDLYFIPVKTGRFDLLCTIDGHADAGMMGSIFVE